MPRTRRGVGTRWTALSAVVLLVTAGCGSSGGDLTIDDPWGRTSPSTTSNAAFYLTIGNETDAAEVLLSASSDACGAVELHRSTMEDGVMSMEPVEGGIEIPAGGETVLEPGGLHVMCIGKQVAFDAGTTVELTLDFATVPDRTVEVEIRAE
jgi:copper(I)-binding protein